MNDNLDSALERIVADISQIRSRLEGLDLPEGDAKQKLLDHLGCASSAALRLRFKSGEDDLIVLDS
ncbi:MAG TPA: hypothetical protein PLN53_03890 [Terricaulis sp.]|nr:hypothetical protein [Terricaulis sp.]